MYSTENTDTGHRVSGNTFLKQIVMEPKVSVGLKKKQVIKTSLSTLLNYSDWIKIFQAFSSATMCQLICTASHFLVWWF